MARNSSRREAKIPAVPTGAPDHADFHAKVYAAVRKIPEGKVASYGDIAHHIGYPRNSRMVGAALKFLPRDLASPYIIIPNVQLADSDTDEIQPEPILNPKWVPWHRVVSSQGVISPRGSEAAVRRQADFLRAEGVEVRDGVREGGAQGERFAPDAFGLAALEGGRVSMAQYRWEQMIR